jgi:hypothetical protein
VKEVTGMSIASDYISGILNEPWYDVTEQYAELLSQWYGDDLSLFDADDEELAVCVRRLTRTFRYWRTDPDLMTPYEKLRRKYEALTEQYQCLLDEYYTLLAKAKDQMALPETNHLNVITIERRVPEHEQRIAA